MRLGWFRKEKPKPVRDYVGPDEPAFRMRFTVVGHESSGTDVDVVLNIGGQRLSFPVAREQLHRFPVGMRLSFKLEGVGHSAGNPQDSSAGKARNHAN